jgi:hypothetical protein
VVRRLRDEGVDRRRRGKDRRAREESGELRTEVATGLRKGSRSMNRLQPCGQMDLSMLATSPQLQTVVGAIYPRSTADRRAAKRGA